jgi:hypothetical protein
MSVRPILRRSRGLALLGAVAALAACSAGPMGRGPAERADVSAPGVSVRQVGQARVTTILDGRAQFPLSLFTGVEPAEAARLLQAGGEAAGGPENVQWHGTVQGFLVDVRGRRVLVDTGAGGMIPGTGGFEGNLAAAGAAPESIQAVLISHFHGDHIGGLLDAQGRARFLTPRCTPTLTRWRSGPTPRRPPPRPRRCGASSRRPRPWPRPTAAEFAPIARAR